jgi:hypothetical protein
LEPIQEAIEPETMPKHPSSNQMEEDIVLKEQTIDSKPQITTEPIKKKD